MRAVSGKGKLRYCPERKKVWNVGVNNNTSEKILYIFSNMPSYGLEKEIAPKNCKEKVV